MCRRQGGNRGRGEVGRDEILLKVPLKRCHYARVALRTLWLFQFPLDLGILALKADFGLGTTKLVLVSSLFMHVYACSCFFTPVHVCI